VAGGDFACQADDLEDARRMVNDPMFHLGEKSRDEAAYRIRQAPDLYAAWLSDFAQGYGPSLTRVYGGFLKYENDAERFIAIPGSELVTVIELPPN
jgi:hypothetical protein